VPGLPIAVRKVRRWFPVILWISGLSAQTCLVLSPATISPNHTALLDLSLYSSPGPAPAAIQWTFQYASSGISSLTLDDGPALTAAGKTAFCAGNAAAYNCLAIGLNTKTIANGIIAKVTAMLAPGATASIQIANPRGSSVSGNLIPMTARVLTVKGAKDSSDCSGLPRPKSLAGGR